MDTKQKLITDIILSVFFIARVPHADQMGNQPGYFIWGDKCLGLKAIQH